MKTPQKRPRTSASRLTLLSCVVAAYLWCPFAQLSVLPVIDIVEHIARSSQIPLLAKKPIIAICAPTRSTGNWGSLNDTKLQTLLLPSIERTITQDELSKWDVRVYLGMDDDDKFWRIHHNKTNTSSWLTVTAAFFNKTKQHRIPFNELTGLAYDDGAEYIVRINDDTEFKTHGWITMGTNTLLSYDPPNIGVVGPNCSQGNQKILTHDMVHRTHMDIFNRTYYPVIFDNWYLDNWISMVYGGNRTTKLPDWEVHHHTAPPRYQIHSVSNHLLKEEIASGRKEIEKFISQKRMEQNQAQNMTARAVFESSSFKEKEEEHVEKIQVFEQVVNFGGRR